MEKYYKHLIIAAAIIIAVIIILFFFRYDISSINNRCIYKLDRLTGTTYERCGYQEKWEKID